MRGLVLLQFLRRGKCFRAVRAFEFVIGIARMHRFHVRLEAALAIEHGRAAFAAEAILARVMEHVRAQLGRLYEALATHRAHVRPFARVNLIVPIEGLFGRKAFAALQKRTKNKKQNIINNMDG